MKKLIILSGFLFSQFFFAQDVTKDLMSFTEVKIYDKISAELIKSDKDKIEIFGSISNDVEVLQKNNELKVRMPLTKLLKGEEIKVKIYYKGILEDIEAFEGSFITSSQVINSRDLEITAKEGAEIKLEIDSEDLEVKAVTGANIYLNGTVSGTMEAEIRTGGNLEAKNLKTKKTKVSISAGGNADVYATDYVKADTKAGGTINIYGKPVKIDQKTVAGGRINQK